MKSLSLPSSFPRRRILKNKKNMSERHKTHIMHHPQLDRYRTEADENVLEKFIQDMHKPGVAAAAAAPVQQTDGLSIFYIFIRRVHSFPSNFG